jgi:hypothetical protein
MNQTRTERGQIQSLEQMIFNGHASKLLKKWSHPADSNRPPTDYESDQ